MEAASPGTDLDSRADWEKIPYLVDRVFGNGDLTGLGGPDECKPMADQCLRAEIAAW
jgi:hypothetical protein